MHYGKFLLYTTIGAGTWNVILAALGWYLHSIVPEEQLGTKIEEYSHVISLAIVGIVALAVAYLLFHHLSKRNK